MARLLSSKHTGGHRGRRDVVGRRILWKGRVIEMDWLHELPLPSMFMVSLAWSFIAALLILLSVRVTLRIFGYRSGIPFPMRDVVVTTTSAMFALMIAF